MRRAALYLGIVLGLLLAGCSGGQPTAEDILAQSAQTMTEVDSLQFLIERQGSPVEIDTGLATAAFSSAEGGRFSA